MHPDAGRVDAEGWLGSLDPIGWRFGLERIRALLTQLDDPQLRFDSVHVVGTNGKSSVTGMTAGLLEASGRRTGCYLSPHDRLWSERVRIGFDALDPEAFQRAAGEVVAAIEVVEAGFPVGERITQFEAATACAFVALAGAGVEVAVIEAGLGGRLDATNVLESRATVLTSIGLDHTKWLGSTELEIAAEKLAVLRPGSTLVLGRVSAAVRDLAERVAVERAARVIDPVDVPNDTHMEAPYLRRNLGVALAAAAVVIGAQPDPATVALALSSVPMLGRFEVRDGEPPEVLDAAHNPAGAEALAEALRTRFPGGRVVGCVAVLADKDAAGMVAALAPVLASVVCTEIPPERMAGVGRPGAAALPAPDLAALFAAHGVEATVQIDPGVAVHEARALAKAADSVALIAGSHYLLSYR